MPLQYLVYEEVFERIQRMEIPFNRYGLDRFGVSQEHLGPFMSLLRLMYDNYFSVESFGVENVPTDSRAMLVGNHSGGVPVDAAMVMASAFLELEPPRLAHGMVEKFANRLPVISEWFSRVGLFTGLPEYARRLLDDDRMLLVFPEGARGTAKLFKDRYELVRFGTGFMRLALHTNTPIVPFAFIGGEEALPTIFHLKRLAKLIGVPYIPVPPHLLPIPLPVSCQIHYGEPMNFEGDGTEADDVIHDYVQQVKERIRNLIERGRSFRRKQLTREELNAKSHPEQRPAALEEEDV